MTIEERVIHYFDLASMPQNLPYDKSSFMRELNITEDDIFNYRKKLEDEVSMKPTEKRDILIKQVIKPLLKKYGFSTGGLDWRRETDDAYIFIHLQNSRFSDISTGACFRFHISASKKDEIREKLSDQWMYNQFTTELKSFNFLPYCGMLSPYYSADWYQIDGYKDYLPTDTPIEDICSQIGEDFDKYVLPELSAVQSYEDFLDLRTQKLKRYEEKEIRLLKFYHAAQLSTTAYGESVFPSLVNLRKKLELTVDDITSHLEWLDIFRERHYLTKYDAKELAIKAAKEENESPSNA
ncbi:MAG: DUF4304 domain-containing protein [Lachnospiraceae bacterium]|nr:DUF4304 domain-containing protein [Lachnospiraceae bacterium]